MATREVGECAACRRVRSDMMAGRCRECIAAGRRALPTFAWRLLLVWVVLGGLMLAFTVAYPPPAPRPDVPHAHRTESWERVVQDDETRMTLTRMRLPSGWLYRAATNGGSFSIAFVPDVAAETSAR